MDKKIEWQIMEQIVNRKERFDIVARVISTAFSSDNTAETHLTTWDFFVRPVRSRSEALSP